MSEIRFCRDCKYGSEVATVGVRAVCQHDKAYYSGGAYEVTGEGPAPRYDCASMRAGICKDGRLWEAKEEAVPVPRMSDLVGITDLMLGRKT